jgi:uncharacterized protein
MSKLNTLDLTALVLIIIGGLNWGFVAFGYNLVDALGSMIAKIVYILVGLSALYVIFIFKKIKA